MRIFILIMIMVTIEFLIITTYSVRKTEERSEIIKDICIHGIIALMSTILLIILPPVYNSIMLKWIVCCIIFYVIFALDVCSLYKAKRNTKKEKVKE